MRYRDTRCFLHKESCRSKCDHHPSEKNLRRINHNRTPNVSPPTVRIWQNSTAPVKCEPQQVIVRKQRPAARLLARVLETVSDSLAKLTSHRSTRRDREPTFANSRCVIQPSMARTENSLGSDDTKITSLGQNKDTNASVSAQVNATTELVVVRNLTGANSTNGLFNLDYRAITCEHIEGT